MKKQYLQQICNKLNERGFTTFNGSDLLSVDRQQFDIGCSEIKALSWLPEENLKVMANSEDCYKSAKDYKDLYQMWGRAGLFKFKPYILDNKDNETLCLRHNKFMHMFRGYHFQISGSPDGQIDYGHGLMRTDGFLNLLRDKNYAKSHLGFIVLYAAMIDCGFQNDNFRSFFYDDKEAVDKYFRQSMKYWYVDFDYGYDIINKYMSYRDGNIDPDKCDHTVYSFGDSGGVWCRFWLSPEAVEVEYCYDSDTRVGNSKVVRFDIPDAIEGLDIKSIGWWTDDDSNDLRDSFEEACYTHESIEDFILLMLLKLIGINSNFMTTFPIKKIGYISRIDSDKIHMIEKYDQIKER